jgi:hypothetical protein
VPKWPIEFYICPECGNYFGSSATQRESMEAETTTTHMVPTGRSRLRCPDCFVMRQVEVDRVWCALELELVPAEETTQ